MKDYILLNYNYLFNDHMAKCSHQAKLYYIKLMFFANNGFVANPKEILDSFGFDIGVFHELVANDELLTLPGRDEVFITAYFIHTRFKPMSWVSTPFAEYWRGKLYIKKNGVATFKKPEETKDPMDQFVQPEEPTEKTKNTELGNIIKGIVELQNDETKEDEPADWDKLLDDIESVNK